MTDFELAMMVMVAREAYLGGRCSRDPRPGDLVVEVTHRVVEPDAIGWLVEHGEAPLNADGTGSTREVWDVVPLSGRLRANGDPIRWENAEFVALPDAVAKHARKASLHAAGAPWEDLDERIRLLRAASRPSEPLQDLDDAGRWSPSAQGHITSALTRLERRRAALQGPKR